MKRIFLSLAIFSLLATGCGVTSADTQATVAAQVNATLAAIPPEQVPVTVQVPVIQEVIVTQPVPVEVPVTVIVEVTAPPSGDQATPAPEATQGPTPTNPPVTSNTGPDPLAGANVTPIIDERFDFPNKYYWWVFDETISSTGEGKIEDETYVMISKQPENYEWTFNGKKLQNFYATATVVLPGEQT